MRTETQKNVSCEVNESDRYTGEITNKVVRAYMERGNCLRSRAMTESFIGLWSRFKSACSKMSAPLGSAKQSRLEGPDRCNTHCGA